MIQSTRRLLSTANNSSVTSLRTKLMNQMSKLRPAELQIPESQLPKYYANAVEEIRTKEKDPAYGDYINSKVRFNWQDDYEIISKIGRGRYSEVFEAINLLSNDRVVVKILKPVKKEKVRREIICLQAMRDCPYAIPLYDQVCDPSNVTPSLIFKYIQHQEIGELYPELTSSSIKSLVLKILIGLDYAHSRGIIHRDIKPGNILMNLRDESAVIADWGLADFYHPSKRFNCRVASRYFKAPELLLNNNYYDYQLDIWSTGCMLAGMMFAKEPFFKGTDNDDQLIRIAKVIGADDIRAYVEAFDHIELSDFFKQNLLNFSKKDWYKFVNSKNEDLVDENGFDLLTKMLKINHTERITAKDAIEHEFFDEVRASVNMSTMQIKQ